MLEACIMHLHIRYTSYTYHRFLTCPRGGIGGNIGFAFTLSTGPPGPTNTGGNLSSRSIFVPNPGVGPAVPLFGSNSL